MGAEGEASLAQLLEIENDSRILEYRYAYKNTPVWPFIRFGVYRSLTSNVLYGEPEKKAKRTVKKADQPDGRRLRQYLAAFLKNPFFSSRKPIMHIYSNLGNVPDTDGTIYNRCFDEYVKLYPNRTYVLEYPERDILCKSQVAKHYKYLYDRAVLAGMKKEKPAAADVAAAEAFLAFLKEKIPAPFFLTNEQWGAVKNEILYWSMRIRYDDRFYRALFCRVKPRIVFIEDGCYGQRNAYLCKVCSELGIVSAEIQHGSVHRNHEAYNYGELLRSSREYRMYLPDYYCGYGSYWLQEINVPVKKVCFGNETFASHYARNYERSLAAAEKRTRQTILWIAFEDNKENIRFLSSFLELSGTKYRILLRLHPLRKERFADTYAQLCRKYPNLEMDSSGNVYEGFVKSDDVVACDSTTIFEALAFGKRVLVYANRAARWLGMTGVGEEFSSPEQLLALLSEQARFDGALREVDREKYFSLRFKENYRAFIRSVMKRSGRKKQ